MAALAAIELLEPRQLLTGTVTASPTLNTTPDPTVVNLTDGTTATLTDSADLEGGSDPGGEMEFDLLGPDGLVDSEIIPVDGNGTYSTPKGYGLPTSGNVAGLYNWEVTYFGDQDNDPVNDDSEFLNVNSAQPTISTTPDSQDVVLDDESFTLNDTADLEGAYNPTGNIVFTLYQDGTLVDTETVGVSGNGEYFTSGYTLPTDGSNVTGNYQWDASYNSDGSDTNNFEADDNDDSSEQVTVETANPSLETTPDQQDIILDDESFTLNDTADLEGGYNPTGTITFTLYQDGSLVDTETQDVFGNGSYSTPFGYPLPTDGSDATGNYQWDAVYNDDGSDTNNNEADDNDDSFEQVTVESASPSLETTPDPTIYTLGSGSDILNDDADLEGGYNPFGTITFSLYYNSGSSPVYTEDVNVSGNGSYNTSGYNITAGPGSYQWDAEYTGDQNNNDVTDNDDPTEQVEVDPAAGNGSISGTKFEDGTGNGLDASDTDLQNVTIDLFLNGASTPSQTTTTAADGTYSFSDLAPGSYFVQEEVPSGWTQTDGNSGYTDVVTADESFPDQDFADFHNISTAAPSTPTSPATVSARTTRLRVASPSIFSKMAAPLRSPLPQRPLPTAPTSSPISAPVRIRFRKWCPPVTRRPAATLGLLSPQPVATTRAATTSTTSRT